MVAPPWFAMFTIGLQCIRHPGKWAGMGPLVLFQPAGEEPHPEPYMCPVCSPADYQRPTPHGTLVMSICPMLPQPAASQLRALLTISCAGMFSGSLEPDGWLLRGGHTRGFSTGMVAYKSCTGGREGEKVPSSEGTRNNAQLSIPLRP